MRRVPVFVVRRGKVLHFAKRSITYELLSKRDIVPSDIPKVQRILMR